MSTIKHWIKDVEASPSKIKSWRPASFACWIAKKAALTSVQRVSLGRVLHVQRAIYLIKSVERKHKLKLKSNEKVMMSCPN